MDTRVSRRTALAAVSSSLFSTPAFAAPSGIRLGGPIYLKSDDPREQAREHRRLGYAAAYCPRVKLEDTQLVRDVEKAYAAENVAISEVGAWVNMLDPDETKRKSNLNYVIQRMALAEAVGARCCVDIAGSYHPTVWYGPHPDNFSQKFLDATVENCRKVIDEVKPKRSKFTMEMMGWAIPEGPDSYLRLIKAVDRRQFAVHLDVCNGINSPERFYKSGDFIRECFRKLGPYITSCHAKDLEWVVELNVHFKETIPGRGKVDYKAYLSELAKLPQDAPLMMEHLARAEEYEEGKKYITGVGRELGLKLV